MNAIQIDLFENTNPQPKPTKKNRTVIPEYITRDFEISAKTSIYRKQASVPLRFLLNRNLLQGSCINFGKGRYQVDSDAIIAATGNCHDYDYNFYKSDIVNRQCHFNSVYCGYVLNTLPKRSRDVVWEQISNLTAPDDGKAFIAVRNNKIRVVGDRFEDGIITSKGTYQCGFTPEKIIEEALCFFLYAKILCYRAEYLIVECSH